MVTGFLEFHSVRQYIYCVMIKKIKKAVSILLGAVFCVALGAGGGWYLKSVSAPAFVPEPEAVFAPFELPKANEGIVTFLAGEGFVLRGGTIEALEIGIRVRAGDSIKIVDIGYCEIQFGGLAAMRMRENTSAVLSSVNTLPGGGLTVKLIAGTLLYKVTKNAGAVLVETENGLIEVAGTEFLVRRTRAEAFVAVREGLVTYGGNMKVPAGFQLRGIKDTASAKTEPLSAAAAEDLKELDRLRMLSLPETGLPRMARVVVEAAPADALIMMEGVVLARGNLSLIVPFGETLRLSVVKSGYLVRDLEIPVRSAEAEKRYLVRLQADPSLEAAEEKTEIEQVLLLESQLRSLEKEIESRKELSLTLTRKLEITEEEKAAAQRENDAVRREKEAALRRIADLEAQVTALNSRLETEAERVKQALELLQGKR
jgi:hypothetical protein